MSHTSITRILAILFAFSLLAACSDNNNKNEIKIDTGDPDFPGYILVSLEPGDDLETRALEALIAAEPNTIVQLPAGTYDFVGELSSSVDNIVLRGTGMDAEGGTVLSFENQTTGSQSIYATGNNFVVEDLAVEDSPSDAIKIEGSDGVTIRRVRVEWTNGPDAENGAYGFYPVQTRNVLIEDSIVRGASDAGVYVGQSEVIIVRRNLAYENVAGIEIENSKFADVYENETTANTGGILVFDLPGPTVQGGEATRVFNNLIVENNEPNFGHGVVAGVPGGTGIMIMANDDIEVFDNTITGNDSIGVLIVSYYFEDVYIGKKSYDPVPEKIYVHDNDMSDNGNDPQDLAKNVAGLFFGGNSGSVFYDSGGVGTDSGLLLLEFPTGLTESQAICIVKNGPQDTFGTLDAGVVLYPLPGEDSAVSQDIAPYNCTHASLPPIELEPPVDPDDPDGPNPLELCDVEGEGINAAAYPADCPNLSDYRLFEDPTNPLDNANSGVIYDLNTPLFTDYANKFRFVYLPDGTQAAYRNEDAFDFPVGTIIAKTFTIQADLRVDSSAQDIIETRLMINRKDGWTALPYIWNPEKTEAVLTKTGGSQTVNWFDLNGDSQSTKYVIPNTNDCKKCHGEDGMLPLGPTARSLNKDYAYDDGSANQLDYWTDHGVLTGAPENTSSIDTIPLWGDTGADLDERARGYLDVNCAHCHNPTGAGSTSGLFLEYDRDFGFEVGECKPPIAAGGGTGGLDWVIEPGDSDESIMPFRMNSNATDTAMPEIGRSIIHTEGLELVEDWINGMVPEDCSSN
jgi:parallel beta-helix repeat protein